MRKLHRALITAGCLNHGLVGQCGRVWPRDQLQNGLLDSPKSVGTATVCAHLAHLSTLSYLRVLCQRLPPYVLLAAEILQPLFQTPNPLLNLLLNESLLADSFLSVVSFMDLRGWFLSFPL